MCKELADAINPSPPSPQVKTKRRGRKKDLQIECEKSFTSSTNNKRNNNAKYTKPIWSFPDLCAVGAGVTPAAARQTSGSLGLDSALDGNWIQECTDWNLDQDHRQDKEQGALQKSAMDEESETLMVLCL